MIDVLDIRDFGAVSGAADTLPSINAAMTANPAPYRKPIYLPPGRWNVSGPIIFNGASEGGFKFFGAGRGTEIVGHFPDFIFKRDEPSGVPYGPYTFDDLWIRNTHPQGKGLQLARGANFLMRNCYVAAFGAGVNIYDAFTVLLQACKFSSYGYPAGNVGIIAGCHTTIDACEITGWETGIRLSGACNNVRGCRIEINKTGIAVGVNAAGQDWMASRGSIVGNSFEANDTTMDLYHCAGMLIAGNGDQGSVNAPSGQSQYGYKVRYATALSFLSNMTAGTYSVSAFKATEALQQCSFEANIIQNAFPGATAWAFDKPHVQTTFCPTV